MPHRYSIGLRYNIHPLAADADIDALILDETLTLIEVDTDADLLADNGVDCEALKLVLVLADFDADKLTLVEALCSYHNPT